jgi:hypothetical protein
VDSVNMGYLAEAILYSPPAVATCFRAMDTRGFMTL